jgi:hypothetical protein
MTSPARHKLAGMEAEPAIQEHRIYTAMTLEGEAAVGRIAIWAAFVEQNLVDLCASLINSDFEVGYAVTANMSASSMIQLAKKLVSESKTVSDEDRVEVQALLTQAKTALEQRNKILHATVGDFMFEGKTAFYNSRRKKGPAAGGQQPQVEAAFHGVEDLDEIAARLFRASEDLWVYVHFPPE